MNVNPSLPEKMKGDEVKLIQIISNLLSNAIKYTEKGKVTLTIDGDIAEDKDTDSCTYSKCYFRRKRDVYGSWFHRLLNKANQYR